MATRLELPNGQWIEVRDKLKVMHEEDQSGYASKGLSSDGKSYDFNLKKHQAATAAVYITAWDVKGDDGQTIQWSEKKPFNHRVEIIRNLDGSTLNQITEVLSGHIKAVEGESNDAKKETPDGETDSAPSSPSAS